MEETSGTTLWNSGITLLAGGLVAVLATWTVADPDLWGHVRFGLDMLRTGGITQADPYSYLTAGERWINHEWLSEVVMALAWKAGGALALILLKMAAALATLGMLYCFLIRGAHLRHLQAAILIVIQGPHLFPLLFHVRPQLFTYLLFALLLIVLVRADKGDRRWLWVQPILFAVWVNLHGGLLAGVGIAGLWTVLHVVREPRTWRRIVPPFCGGVLATLINPYGPDLLVFLARTATVPRPEVLEWRPITMFSGVGLYYAFVLMVHGAGLMFSRRPRVVIPMILFGIAALLPWIAVRHLPLFSIAAVVLTGEHVGSAWNLSFGEPASQPSVGAALGLIATAAALTVFGLAVAPRRIGLPREGPPITAVQLLKQSHARGNLAVDFRWGEYVIWHLGPAVKVSIDGRRETVYSQHVYEQNLNFMYGEPDWRGLLTNYPTDMVLIRRSPPIHGLMLVEPGWLLIFEDEASALFVKRSSLLLVTVPHVADRGPVNEGLRFFP